MKTINRLLFTLICLSLFIGLYFFSCSPGKDTVPIQPKNNAEKISKRQGEIVLQYQRQSARLQTKNDSLAQSIAKSQSDIKALRRQVRDLKFSLSQKLADSTQSDTGQLIEDCAQIKAQAKDLIILTDRQDSICQQTVEQYEQLVSVKDTIIQSCLHRTFRTDSLLSVSLQSQRQLESQFKAKAKELGKRRRAVNFLSAGLLIFSTSSLILFLTRH